MKITTSASSPPPGFTLVEIMIVVAIIGLLASMAVPAFGRARQKAQQQTCIVNLRQIEGAVQQWATDMNKGVEQPVTHRDILVYLRNAVTCPSGGTTFEDSYTLTTVDAPPACQRVPAGPLPHTLPPRPSP